MYEMGPAVDAAGIRGVRIPRVESIFTRRFGMASNPARRRPTNPRGIDRGAQGFTLPLKT
ncbi:hypothetical protein Lbir_0873 [Legionella birminghamensis]|uniref:Uncharacterized protein n=1 Tax=Legionella birminghamensis TaxID=28083 RepID=A0A378ICW4_9GAMM|nr:hypothetical protein Lbir_0873 [Legionella birminghamensis]STX32595.1 Uncharacterised protein [Legionella birminghamensis]